MARVTCKPKIYSIIVFYIEKSFSIINLELLFYVFLLYWKKEWKKKQRNLQLLFFRINLAKHQPLTKNIIKMTATFVSQIFQLLKRSLCALNSNVPKISLSTTIHINSIVLVTIFIQVSWFSIFFKLKLSTVFNFLKIICLIKIYINWEVFLLFIKFICPSTLTDISLFNLNLSIILSK